MTLIGAIVFFACFAVVALLAYWVITKFFPEPAKMVALAIVGVLLLLVLLAQFFPEAGNFRVWK